jgi:hypothetical protein
MTGLGYRLYQDGEIDFTLQAPDNSTIAVLGVHYSSEGYFTLLPPEKQFGERKEIYLGQDRQEAIRGAYFRAVIFAKSIDPDFKDLTKIGELEGKVQTSESPKRTVIPLREVLEKKILKEQIPHLNEE